MFIAAAAERTKHIKLGTGVNSLPYHHPFMLADRIVMLDHLTRGRMMFGVGPGQLTSDAMMLGIDPQQQRPRMEEAFDVIMRAVPRRDGHREDRLVHVRPGRAPDAAVQRLRHRRRRVDLAVGLEAAGRYGIGLLSIAATDPMGFDMLGRPLEGLERAGRRARPRRRPRRRGG